MNKRIHDMIREARAQIEAHNRAMSTLIDLLEGNEAIEMNGMETATLLRPMMRDGHAAETMLRQAMEDAEYEEARS